MSNARVTARLVVFGVALALVSAGTPRALAATTGWVKALGGTGDDSGASVVTDTSGNVINAGYFSGTVNFGGGALASAGATDIFVAKYSSTGVYIWAKRFGGVSTDQATRVAVDSSGNVLVTGYFSGTVDFGGGALTSAGALDIFVLKLSSSGTHLWSKRFGSTVDDVGYGVAVDSADNVFITGSFQGTVSFGGASYTTFAGYNLFLAKYSSGGTFLWSLSAPASSRSVGRGLVVDASNNPIVTGDFAGSVNLGGGALTAAGSDDILLAKYSGVDGSFAWGSRFGNTGADVGYAVATDIGSNVLLTGYFTSSIDFGGGSISTTGGAIDGFAVKFTTAGAHVWSKRMGAPLNAMGYGVAADSSNNVFVTGYYQGTANFSGQTVTNAGAADVFVSSYSSAGTHLNTDRFGGTSSDVANGIAINSQNGVIITGRFQGTSVFLGQTVVASGLNDIFLVSLGTTAGSVHYIDNTATGANDGSSWVNAWTGFSQINWGAVSPGDTIFISGGVVNQTYTETFTFGKAGTAGNLITLRAGQDVGHNGTAIINGNYVDMRRSYTAIDGNVGGACHFAVQNFYDTVTADFAKAIYADGAIGNVVSYVGITNCNNGYNNIGGYNWTVSHCALDEIRGDAAIRTGSTPDNGYAQNIIEYCDIRLSRNDGTGPPKNGVPMLGPDGVQGGHSITVRYSRFRLLVVSYLTSYQHPDYTQLIGNHTQIYGNEFWNIGDSANDFDCWVNATMSHVQIYNNLYRITQDIDPYPEFIRLYSGSATMIALDDWLIANNVFVDNGWNNIRLIWRGTPTLTNWKIENNIFVNSSPYEIASNISGAIVFSNNIYYPGSTGISYLCAPAGGFTSCNNYTATSWSAVEPTRIVGLPTFVSYTYRATGNDFHLAASDTTAVGAGLNLSAYFTVDKDGVTRSVPWTCGPYQQTATPSPGSLGLPNLTYSVVETAGSIAVSARRSGGSAGAVGAHYATANDTALAGVNYTSTSGTFSWADGDTADKSVNIPILNAGFQGQKQFTFGLGSATGGATLDLQTNSTVVITGAGAPTPLAGTSWPATDGQISAPMTASSTNYIVQNVEIGDPTLAGVASYTFTNSIGTNLVVLLSVDAPTGANNSIFVNFNSLPTDPTMISDIYPFTSGFTNHLLSWRGTGTFDANQFVPKVFTVPLGLNTLYILGRESGVKIAHVTVQAPSTNLPPIQPAPILPPPSSINIAPITSLEGSPYSDPQGSAHTASQFQVYLSSQTTLLWDSGAIDPVETVISPWLGYSHYVYWRVRYQNALGLWSDWSDLATFATRSGTIIRTTTFRTGV